MSSLLFLDLETSGLEEEDRICELALIVEEGDDILHSQSLCKSPKKISSGAMALHHITNEMIKESPLCPLSEPYRVLERFNSEENLLIAHNLRFDLKMLEKEGFKSKLQVIDTLRCVKSLIPECEEFRLQFLRYELGLYKEEKAEADKVGLKLTAHRALSDAFHVRLLFHTLLEYATLAQLIDISSKPVLLEKFSFGKYSGRYIEEIINIDASYVQWMLGNIEDMDEDLAYSLKYYMDIL
jgi:DNA polymerase III epsilon subunit-like protein